MSISQALLERLHGLLSSAPTVAETPYPTHPFCYKNESSLWAAAPETGTTENVWYQNLYDTCQSAFGTCTSYLHGGLDLCWNNIPSFEGAANSANAVFSSATYQGNTWFDPNNYSEQCEHQWLYDVLSPTLAICIMGYFAYSTHQVQKGFYDKFRNSTHTEESADTAEPSEPRAAKLN